MFTLAMKIIGLSGKYVIKSGNLVSEIYLVGLDYHLFLNAHALKRSDRVHWVLKSSLNSKAEVVRSNTICCVSYFGK